MNESSSDIMQKRAAERLARREMRQRAQAESLEAMKIQTAALLKTMDTSYVPSAQEPTYSGYHRAAAVLATFDPHTLRPAGPASPEDLQALMADSAPTGRVTPQRYALRPEMRRKILKQIGARPAMEQALEANPDRPSDAEQAMLEAYIHGSAPAVAKQNAGQLAGAFQVVQWLEGILDGLPSQEAVQQRWEQVDLLRPFNQLAGARVRGREQELERMRSYVFDPAPDEGGKPPLVFWGPGGVGKSALLARFIEKLAERPPDQRVPWVYLDFDRPSLDPAEPLTLIVQSVRQLAAQNPGRRQSIDTFAAYLQERLVASYQRGQEMQRQDASGAILGTVTGAVIGNIGRGALKQEAQRPDAARASPGATGPASEWDSYLRNLASLLELLAQPETPTAADGSPSEADIEERLKQREAQQQQAPAPDQGAGQAASGPPPFFMALDTFEEVQYRSNALVDRLFDFLAALRRWAPQVRPILAGRNEVHSLSTEVDSRVLGNLPPEAARALLEAGEMPPDWAARIVERVGCNPLNLHLALDLFRHRRPGEELSQLMPEQEADLDLEIQQAQMQGMLLTRILQRIHIDDGPEVQRLAHPGLVLRRVTPELIEKVLARPCGLRVKDRAQAEELFDRLAKEEALVTVEGRALRHRPDVRPVMVRLLRESDPRQVQAIERAAVRYYARGDSPEDRAEEIYHRLSLKQPLGSISRRWADAEKRGWTEQMGKLLTTARDELEPRQRAWLAAKLDFELTPEESRDADQASWEEQTERSVRRYLDDAHPDAAMKTLAERSQWLPGSPLYALAAQAYELLDETEKAREFLVQGYRSAAQKGDRTLALALRLQTVRLDLRLGDHQAAAKRLESAQKVVQGGAPSPMSLLEIDLYRLAVARAAEDTKAIELAVPSLLERAAKVSDRDLGRDPTLAAWLAAEVGAEHTPLMVRVLSLIGLWREDMDALETLVVALAGWDVALSKQLGAAPGALAREAGLQLAPEARPSQTWRAYLREAKPEESGQALAHLLAAATEAPAEVREALAAMMRQRAGPRAPVGQKAPEAVKPEATTRAEHPEPKALPESPVGPSPTPPVKRGRAKLSGQILRAFSTALVGAFPTEADLRQFLLLRLDVNLETLSMGDSLRQSVFDLVRWADARGLTLQLLDAARNARPDNPELAALADQLGLGVAREQDWLDSKQIETVTGGLVDPQIWRSRLARLETQVCRVEVGSQMMGTGFLLGPSMALTSYPVVEQVIKGLASPDEVGLRFDYQVSPDGATLNEGLVFRLEKDWLVHASPVGADPWLGEPSPEELGFALLRAARQPGYSGVGNIGLESLSQLRGWVELPTPPPKLEQGAPLFVLHHPQGQPLRLSGSLEAIVSVNPSGTRVRYRLDTAPGSGGAPCFDAELALVALHLGSTHEQVCFGTPLQAILDQLGRQGLAHLLGGEER